MFETFNREFLTGNYKVLPLAEAGTKCVTDYRDDGRKRRNLDSTGKTSTEKGKIKNFFIESRSYWKACQV
jgi:hypothetical protein